MGFIIWAAAAFFLMGMGIWSFFRQKAVSFWSNIKPYPVNDVKGYNRAVGILFFCYGAVFLLLGLPLLKGQNSPFVLLSILGVMFETIVLMAVYQLKITPKYKNK